MQAKAPRHVATHKRLAGTRPAAKATSIGGSLGKNRLREPHLRAGHHAATCAAQREGGPGSASTTPTTDPAPTDARDTAPTSSPAATQQPSLASPSPVRSSGSGGAADDGLQAWLSLRLPLPGGRAVTRREALKLLPLAGGLGCLYVAATRAQALSYTSPAALLNALAPPRAPDPGAGRGDRVAAFTDFIADLERRGGGRPVPEFPAGADWLNTAPLRMAGPPASRGSLAGRVVLLDFWTYCCINCLHVLPDLAQLESQFAGAPVAVVGVHSAKFDNEKDSSAIRDAVLRYGISHPVVNDRGMALWGGLGVSSWPTLALVSPRGRLIAMLSGEGHRQDLEDLITAALSYYGAAGQLDGSAPLPLALERDKQASAASPLRYPGGVAVDPTGPGRLFIADSANHRVLITDMRGRFLDQIGGNGPALRDGAFETAAFNRPQGLAYSPARRTLYVADAESHAVRACGLEGRAVVTLAGNGAKGGDYRGGRAGTAQPLNSPWDVELDETEDRLYIALAGQHQIWRLDLASGAAAALSGSGRERNANGLSGATTDWAQPSGLARARDGSGLFYVADSESSSVRVLDPGSGAGGLKAGGDPLFSDNLFRFGDKDGFGPEALLQHPMAVAASPDGSVVYVADSYNHRIKTLNPATDEIVTLVGSGAAGFRDGLGTEAQLSEPAGLAVGPNGVLVIADTNNNAIRLLDPATRRVSTLALEGVPPPRVDPLAAIPAGAAAPAALPAGFQLVRSAEPLAVGPGGAGSLTVTIRLPAGYHLTKGAGSSYYTQVVAASGTAADVASIVVRPGSGELPDSDAPSVALSVSSSAAVGGSGGGGGAGPQLLLRVLAKVYYCQQNSVCLFEQVCFEAPLALAAGSAGGAAVGLRYDVVPPPQQPGFMVSSL